MKVHIRADNLEQAERWINYIRTNYPAGRVKVKADGDKGYNIWYTDGVKGLKI